VLVPRDSRAHHALRDDPPPSVAGNVVFSLPSSEVLLRDADDVRRAVDLAPPGA
jgi:hypothetical protein